MKEYKRPLCIHIYQEIWVVAVGEVLVCVREPRNTRDRYVVAVSNDYRLLTADGFLVCLSEPIGSGRPAIVKSLLTDLLLLSFIVKLMLSVKFRFFCADH